LYQDSSEVWNEVELLLINALGSGDFENSPLGKLMADTGGVDIMNYLDSAEWWNDLKNSLNNYDVATNYEIITNPDGTMKLQKKYATGGLADFTGPAWLDGTKSRPELVLNQTDTANFIALKNVLADVMKNNFDSSRKTGDQNGNNYFDIEINVETLENDYEVEQIADKIRDMIYKDATYRNVNAVN
jgi:hypothetical protein